MTTMRFGAMLPQGWKMDLVDYEGAAEKWGRLCGVAAECDALGFESVWLYDHFHTVPRPSEEAVFECWTSLAALAEATERVRLGQMVTCNSYRPPALLAKIAACVDVISGGRVEFGIGAGWYRHEYRGYGYDFPSAGTRISMLEEAVRIIRSLWTEPRTDFEGRHYRIEGALGFPKPLQDPHPPIWIGGSGERKTLRVVAELADWSNFGGKTDEFSAKCEVLKGHCADVGRDYDAIGKSWQPDVVIAETEKDVDDRLAGGGSIWGEAPESYRRGHLVGTPEQICERIEAYADLGCRYVVCYFRDLPSTDGMRLFSERVIRNFQFR